MSLHRMVLHSVKWIVEVQQEIIKEILWVMSITLDKATQLLELKAYGGCEQDTTAISDFSSGLITRVSWPTYSNVSSTEDSITYTVKGLAWYMGKVIPTTVWKTYKVSWDELTSTGNNARIYTIELDNTISDITGNYGSNRDNGYTRTATKPYVWIWLAYPQVPTSWWITVGVEWLKLQPVPSPTNPINIVCNNWTIRVKDRDLPIGYRRLLGIATNWLNYARYVTDIYLQGSDTIKFSYAYRGTSNGANLVWCYVGSSSQANFSYYASVNAGGSYARYNWWTYNSTCVRNTRYDIVMSPTGVTGWVNSSTWTEKTFTSTVKFCIFATAPTGDAAENVAGRWATIYENVEVVGKALFIPCERVSDGVIWYYDTYSQKFYWPTLDGGSANTLTSLWYDDSQMGIWVGEISQNLINPNAITRGGYVNWSGNWTSSSNYWATDYIKISNGVSYIKSNITSNSIALYDSSKTFVERINATSFTATYDGYVRLNLGATDTNMQFEKWSEATPYRPYWIYYNKETISNGTNSVLVENLLSVWDYVDEQSILNWLITRKVGVYVITGEEGRSQWHAVYSDGTYRVFANVDIVSVSWQPMMCSHFPRHPLADRDVENLWNAIMNGTSQIHIRSNAFSTVADAKTRFATQYANWTPVIVVYPLATETTESVAGQSLAVSGNTTLSITQASLDDLKLYAKYKALP